MPKRYAFIHQIKFIAIFIILLTVDSFALSRIKDIANFEGFRNNQLVGYGLVVGLNGTGDDLKSTPFTKESLVSMLERLGINTRNIDMSTKNVAAVMVTATLPPFARQGTTIDVNVSAFGNSKSLMGGTLLVTPLVGADGEVYAVGQGSLATSGFSAKGANASITKGVPTHARITGGAIIEKELGYELNSQKSLRLNLLNPDFTTSRRISEVINGSLGSLSAKSVDAATINLIIPDHYKGNVIGFITDIEQLIVSPDQPARVIVDDHDGVIVMGEKVRISSVAITHGSLNIRITETPSVSQPNAFSQGATVAGPGKTDINVNEGADKKMAVLPETATLNELVNALNALGVSPRDMISILQNIKAIGALQADIETL